jgi:hypothetical protein
MEVATSFWGRSGSYIGIHKYEHYMNFIPEFFIWGQLNFWLAMTPEILGHTSTIPVRCNEFKYKKSLINLRKTKKNPLRKS